MKISAAGGLAILFVAGALTEAVAQTEEVAQVETVVVTAQRRAENLQDVGISITAFSGDQLASMGVANSMDLVQITPGLRNPKSNSGFTSSYSIRGLSQSDYGASQEAPVALYVDDVYYASQGAADFGLFDIDRVEVLRGPQGTLYGRNATGGLVHYITQRPTGDFGGYANISYGRFNEVKAQGAVNIPLADDLAVRVSGGGDWHDPLVKNLDGPNIWNGDQFGLRAQALYKPTEDVSFLLSGRFGQRRESGAPWLWSSARPTGEGGVGEATPGQPDYFGFTGTGGDPFLVALDPISKNHSNTRGITGTLNWNFSGMTLTSITDYNSLYVDFAEDSDMEPGEYFEFFGTQKVKQFSQELRLSGDSDELHWVAGGYYLHVRGNFLQSGHIRDLGYGVDVEDTLYDTRTDSESVFAQAEFKLNNEFRAIVGARLIFEQKGENYDSAFKIGDTKVGFGSSPDLLLFQGTDNSTLYAAKAELDWTPNENQLVYASYNRGVKAGGFNAPLDPSGSPAFIDPITYDPSPTADSAMRFGPETLHSFELGSKTTFWDGKARFNVSAFYYDYLGYQAFNFEGVSTSYIQNRDATLKGFDADLAVTPIGGLDIAAGASYLDQVVHDVQVGSLFLDRKISYAPMWNLTGQARYEWVAFSGSIAVQANVNYVSSQYFGLTNAPVVKEGGYAIGNARITYNFMDDHADVAAFIDNIGDTRYRTTAFDLAGSFGSVESQIGFPRTYGVELGYKW